MTEPSNGEGAAAAADLDLDVPAGGHDALAARGSADLRADAPAVEVRAPLASSAFAGRRAELGMSLEDVANQLKFAPRQIAALEAGDFDKLPGGTFARGMLRGYARLLKLDPAPILAQFLASGGAAQAGPEQAVSLRTPIPFSESGTHVNLVYMVLTVVILAIGAFFAFEWYQEKSGPPKLTFVTPAQDSPAGQGAAGDAIRPSTFASAGPSPVPETTPRADEKKTAPVAPGRRRIVLVFDRESWVEIKARNDAVLLSQMNPAGSEKVIDGEPPFLVTIGNAPSVRVTYNDLPVDLRPHYKVDVARFTLN